MIDYDDLRAAPRVAAREAAAIIGVGAILPDAPNARRFWENILGKRYSIKEVPPSRWRVKDYYDPDPGAEDRTYCKIGAFVEGFDFDSIRYKIPPKTAAAMDLVQQWAIVAACEALSDAGYMEKEFDRQRTAVIMGNALLEESINQTNLRVNLPVYVNSLLEDEEFMSLPPAARERIIAGLARRIKRLSLPITEDTMPGELSNVITGRVANVLNLRGANYTTDAACASSLAAVNSAFGGLRRGEYDIVIAGGVDRSMSPSTFIKFCKIGALSPEGSFPFDERASGFVMGEGCACFVMKRYSDALRDGDRILAVVAGIGTSSDGRGKGITAPNAEGQILALERAYESTGIDPNTIDMIEAHGTATRVGDAAEMEVVARAMRGRSRSNPVAVTSVKSQIGHLKSAAGAASILKAALAIHNRVLPPSINFEEPSHGIPWSDIPVRIQTESEPWPGNGRPGRAGVSSFGFGGTNFHMLLQEAEPVEDIARRSGRRFFAAGRAAGGEEARGHEAEFDPRYYEFSIGLGDEIEENHEAREMTSSIVSDMLERVAFLGGGSLEEIAAAILGGKRPRRLSSMEEVVLLREEKWRLAVAFRDEIDLTEKIAKIVAAAARGLDEKKLGLLRRLGVYVSGATMKGVGYLYPGQGSQSMNMLSDLRERYPTFRKVLERADGVMEPLLGKKLTSIVYTEAAEGSPEWEGMDELLKQTEVTQPAMLAVDYALTLLLEEMGIFPDYVTGHSLGEYAALVAAGVIKFEDCLEIVAARGKEMASVSIDDPGMMFAAMADSETVDKLLAEVPGYLVPANKNSSRQTVVAGSTEAVKRAMQVFEAEGIRTVPLRVSHAFHSKIVAGATEPLRKVLRRYEFARPGIPVFGNVTGRAYPMDASRDHFIDVLGRQIASPVEFIECLKNMHGAGARFFLEVGPRRVLASFAEDVLPAGEAMTECANNHRLGDMESLACLFAAAAAAGVIRMKKEISPGERIDKGTPELREGPQSTAMVSQERLLGEILALVSEKTGYPVDMLDPAMDMEADLGIDTVKQAELFSLVRKKYNIPRQENLKLKDYPTINHVVGFVSKFIVTSGPEAPADSSEEAPAAVPVGPVAAAPPPRRGDAPTILVSGAALGLPGRGRNLFGDSNFDEIFEGKNFIEEVPKSVKEKFVDLNMTMIDKGTGDDLVEKKVESISDAIKLAGQMGRLDLVGDYGIAPDFAGTMDETAAMAVAAGLEALSDAGIPLVLETRKTTTGARIPVGWHLPEDLQDSTGVIFASAFPGYNRFAAELEKYFRHAFLGEKYEFDRKLLFGILAMGHTQLAQAIKARGPNLQVNGACASTLIAMATAFDWIRAGRCRRVLVVSADNTSSERLLPWIGGGFLSNGGAATDQDVREAAIPFDRRRHGLIVGMGAAAIVLETEDEVRSRGMRGLARLAITSISNSAFHGTRLDPDHISRQMTSFVNRACEMMGCSVEELARGLVFLSHETYTPARGGSASAEVRALRSAFGQQASGILVANTKGFTGHPMGVGIEEAVAPMILHKGRVPPVANLAETDPEFGDINLSLGGDYPARRVLRFAAGFGSQVAMAILEKDSDGKERIADGLLHQSWLEAMAGGRKARTFTEGRVLKLMAENEPALEDEYVETPVDESLYEPVDEINAVMRKTVRRWLPTASRFDATGVKIGEGDAIVLHGGCALRDEVERMLAARKVKVIDSSSAGWKGLERPARGIIFFEDEKLLPVPALEELPLLGDAVVEEAARRFALLQEIVRDGKLDEDKGFILGVSFGGGRNSGEGVSKRSISFGALTGFVKSIAFEFPSCVVKAVDIDPLDTQEEAAELLVMEALHDRGSREIGIYGGARWALDLEEIPIPPIEEAAGSSRKVYLVTGAGGAVMADVVRKIAKMAPADFVLLDVLKPEKTSGGRWSRSFGRVMSVMQYVERMGGSAMYVKSDVTDSSGVAMAVKSALVRFGRIDVVLHGAGLERSRSVLKKPPEEFRKIVSIKVNGACNLLGAVLGKGMKAKFIFFSSVAGRFGNAGQADYSAGNDFMAGLASSLSGHWPGVEMTAIDWTAWEGEGMAGSGAIRAVLEEAGVEMLSRREGCEVLWRLVRGQSPAPEVVVSGKLGLLFDSYNRSSREEVELGAAPGRGASASRGEVRRKVVVSPASDVYLWDHAVEGTPVFPAVKGLELFHETCIGALGEGWVLRGIRDAVFTRAVKFFSGSERELFLRNAIARAGGGLIQCRCMLETEERSRAGAGGLVKNFEARLLFERADGNGGGKMGGTLVAGSGGPGAAAGLWDSGTEMRSEGIYRFLFHKNQFQVVDSFRLGSEKGEFGLAVMKRARRPDLGGLYLLVEFGMQAAGLYLLRAAGEAALPMKIESVSLVGGIDEATAYLAVARYRGMSEGGSGFTTYRFDVSISDPEGGQVLWIDGLDLVRTESMPEARALAGGLPKVYRAAGAGPAAR